FPVTAPRGRPRQMSRRSVRQWSSLETSLGNAPREIFRENFFEVTTSLQLPTMLQVWHRVHATDAIKNPRLQALGCSEPVTDLGGIALGKSPRHADRRNAHF